MDDRSESGPSFDAGADVFTRNGDARRRRARATERAGLEHLERGLLDSAVAALREVAEVYDGIGERGRADAARQYMALAMYELGAVDEAVGTWEDLVAGGWDRPTALNFLIRHYEAQGQQERVDGLYSRLSEAIASGGGFFEPHVEAGAAPPGRSSIGLILVADGDAAIRHVLGSVLERQGYEILYAEDGDAASAAVFGARPDLVFLDVYMPVQSGLDLLYKMRAEGDQTPVIVLSGRPHATMVRDSEVLGAHLARKPLDFEQLSGMLRRLLPADSGS